MYPISSMLDIEEIEGRNLAKIAIFRCIFIAMQIKLAQLETGSYPTSLDFIKTNYPGYIIDPYTSLQFIYKNNENSYLLYSIGKNLEDNGGDVVYVRSNNKSVELDNNAKDIGIVWEK